MTLMAAAARVPLRMDGSAPPPQNSDKLAAAKSVATASKLAARGAMTATPTLVMGAQTRAQWSVVTIVMGEAAAQPVETGRWLVTRNVTTKTPTTAMDAAARVSRKRDGSAAPVKIMQMDGTAKASNHRHVSHLPALKCAETVSKPPASNAMMATRPTAMGALSGAQ